MNAQADRVGLIWSIAELLRHDYKASEARIILPPTDDGSDRCPNV